MSPYSVSPPVCHLRIPHGYVHIIINRVSGNSNVECLISFGRASSVLTVDVCNLEKLRHLLSIIVTRSYATDLLLAIIINYVFYCRLLSPRAPPRPNSYLRLLSIVCDCRLLSSHAPPRPNCYLRLLSIVCYLRLLSSRAPPRRAVTCDYY